MRHKLITTICHTDKCYHPQLSQKEKAAGNILVIKQLNASIQMLKIFFRSISDQKQICAMTHPHLYIQAMSLSLLKPDVVYVLQTKKTQRKFELTDALSEKTQRILFSTSPGDSTSPGETRYFSQLKLNHETKSITKIKLSITTTIAHEASYCGTLVSAINLT